MRLALLYRASVEAMAARAEVALVPGATEAECLRASRGCPMAKTATFRANACAPGSTPPMRNACPAHDEFDALLSLLHATLRVGGMTGWAQPRIGDRAGGPAAGGGWLIVAWFLHTYEKVERDIDAAAHAARPPTTRCTR